MGGELANISHSPNGIYNFVLSCPHLTPPHSSRSSLLPPSHSARSRLGSVASKRSPKPRRNCWWCRPGFGTFRCTPAWHWYSCHEVHNLIHGKLGSRCES